MNLQNSTGHNDKPQQKLTPVKSNVILSVLGEPKHREISGEKSVEVKQNKNKIKRSKSISEEGTPGKKQNKIKHQDHQQSTSKQLDNGMW